MLAGVGRLQRRSASVGGLLSPLFSSSYLVSSHDRPIVLPDPSQSRRNTSLRCTLARECFLSHVLQSSRAASHMHSSPVSPTAH